MAKGYYWGDALKEGFYDQFPKTEKLAKIGWKHIDEKKSARTLESILELEKNSIDEEPKKEDVYIERKKEEIVPKKNTFRKSNVQNISEDVIIKTYSDSRTPPPRRDPEPYQVYY